MAKVVFSGVESRAAQELASLLMADGHEVQRAKNNISVGALLNADVVFAGGEPEEYLPVLRRIRAANSTLCFVVIVRYPTTGEWLNALDAGATDYWASPFAIEQIRLLMTTANRHRGAAATAAR